MRKLTCLLVVFAGLTLAGTGRAADDDKDFTKLFNGKDFTNFKLILENKDADPLKTWSVKDGVIICTGKPAGYFYTEKPYKNYILRFDVKYTRPSDLADDSKFGGNSGFLVHIDGEHKVWPRCIEVQGMNRNMGDIFAIGSPKPTGEYKKDAEAQKKAIKPVGQWNEVEIVSKDGMLTCTINGTRVAEGKGELKEGAIGWQSEGAEIQFRNIRIKEMK